MKEQLDQVMKEQLKEGEKVTLVAHDIGGPPTLLWASENEERVERLILLNTIIYPFKTKLDAFSERILATPILKDIFVSPFGLRQVMRTNTRQKGKAINEQIEEIIAPYKKVSSELKRRILHEPLVDSRANGMYGLSEKFKALKVEKHLVIAEHDPLLYEHIKKLSDENPEVPVHYIEDCGHFIPIGQPEALSKILLSIMTNSSS